MQNPLETYLSALESRLQRLDLSQREAELREVRSHLEALVASHLAAGHNPDDAMQMALAQFGSAEQLGKRLSQVGFGTRAGLAARWAGKALFFWACWFGVSLGFFDPILRGYLTYQSAISGKPVAVPFQFYSLLLGLAATATFSVFSIAASKKRRLRRACS